MIYVEVVIGRFTFKTSATMPGNEASTAQLTAQTEVAPPFGFCADNDDEEADE